MHINSLSNARTKYFYTAWGIFLLLLIAITFFLPFNGLYGQDSHEYFRFSQRLQSVILHGTAAGDFFYPVIYPLLGAILGMLLPDLASMQWISLFSFFLAAGAVSKILEFEYPENQQYKFIFISVFFLCAPYLIRGSLVIMSDMLALFFITAALLQYQRYKSKPNLQPVFLFGLCSSLAISTRYSAFVIVLIPLILMGIRMLFVQKKIGSFVFLLFSIIIGLIPQLFIKGFSDIGIVAHPLWQELSFDNMIASQFNIVEGHLNYTLPNLLYPLYTWVHPGFLIIGLPLLFFIRKDDFKRSSNILVLCIIILYAIFLAAVPFQNMRFLILCFPFVFIFLFPAFRRAYSALTEFSSLASKLTLITLLVVQLGLAGRALYPFLQMNNIERTISKELKEIAPSTVYTFAMDVPLRSYGAKFSLVNLRHDSIDNASRGDYVLFNESRFSKQWKDKTVMNNWEALNQRFQLEEIRIFDQNWTLYELR